jgi:hypothetical protein
MPAKKEDIEIKKRALAKVGWPMKDDDILHVYGQEAWHDTVIIVGSEMSLTKLKHVINEALTNPDKNSIHEMRTYVNDGEGYDLKVIVLESDDEAKQLITPYTKDYAQDADDKLEPEKLWEDRKKSE